MSDWILGIGGSSHDFSAALALGTDIRVAIEQERLSRRKHGLTEWFEDPTWPAVEYCLMSESIELSAVKRIVGSDVLPKRTQRWLMDFETKLYRHHLCHAASAYMMAPIGSKAGVIVYDGFGSVRGPADLERLRSRRETISLFIFDRSGYRCVGETFGDGWDECDEFPVGVTNSLGMLYEITNSKLGFHLFDAGKTMGLASYGLPTYLEELEEFVSYGDGPSDCFACDTSNAGLLTSMDEFLARDRGSFAAKANLAASVQAVLEKVLARCAAHLLAEGVDYLCLSGGCALNTVATSRLIDRIGGNTPVLVPPHCGDAGLGLGAVWLDRFEERGALPSFTFRGLPAHPALARPGRLYSKDEHRQAAMSFYPRVVADSSVDTTTGLARALAEGAIIGTFGGRSEFGPRALGGRSILADPRSVLVRERINRRIKEREPFRPLAAMVLESEYGKYFSSPSHSDEFMLKIAYAQEACQKHAPAVVHIDGSSRIQVVPDDGDSFLAGLLYAFKEITGVPILLNTSFNRRGEPIVETPLDAVDAAIGMGLDGVYLEGLYYRVV